MCFDRNINGNRDVKFLIGIIGHCTDKRNLLYLSQFWLHSNADADAGCHEETGLLTHSFLPLISKAVIKR